MSTWKPPKLLPLTTQKLPRQQTLKIETSTTSLAESVELDEKTYESNFLTHEILKLCTWFLEAYGNELQLQYIANNIEANFDAENWFSIAFKVQKLYMVRFIKTLVRKLKSS